VDRLSKSTVYTVTQMKPKLQCEVLTASGNNVEDKMDTVTEDQQTVLCEVLTDSGQTRRNQWK